MTDAIDLHGHECRYRQTFYAHWVCNYSPYLISYWKFLIFDILSSWEAAPGNTSTFTVPDDWQSGRIWVSVLTLYSLPFSHKHKQGRTDCDFSKPNASSCATGGCNGGLLCDEHSGTVSLVNSYVYGKTLISMRLGCSTCNRCWMDTRKERESR